MNANSCVMPEISLSRMCARDIASDGVRRGIDLDALERQRFSRTTPACDTRICGCGRTITW